MVTIKVDFDEIEPADDGTAEMLRNGQLFSGIAYERDESGAFLGVAGFHHGGKHGPWRDWFTDGRLHKEWFFFEGFRNGPWREWHQNGQLAYDAYWECDFCIRSKRWSELGELIKSYEMTPDDRDYPTLVERRKRQRWAVVDIELDTLEFVERPHGWGRDGTEQV